MELFRKEVIEHQNRRLYGEVTVTTPLSTVVMTMLLAAIVVLIIVGLLFGSYAKKERVTGWLTPDKGLSRVVSSGYGIVETVHVGDGDVVEVGQPLITLSLDSGLVSGGDAVAAQLGQINSEEQELRTRLNLAGERYVSERTEMARRLEKLRAEHRLLLSEQTIQADRIVAAEELYEAMRSIEATSGLETKRQYEALLVLRQSREQLAQQIIAKDREIGQLQAQIDASPNNEQTELSELRGQLAMLAQRRTELESQGRTVMRAALGGRVAALPARAGQSVAPRTLLAAILPEGGQLEAELFVPTRAAGFIASGQPVRIRYDAFPYQKFGVSDGVVQSVSRTIFNPDELPPSIPLDEPAYRVSIRIGQQFVSAGEDRFPLQSGMTLQADIVQEKQRLWSLLFGSLNGGV